MTTDLPTSSPVHRKVVWGAPSGSLDLDIRCAVMSRGGVLITGPMERAEALAREIHRRSETAAVPAQVVDCANQDAMLAVLDASDAFGDGPLLLKNVDRLSLHLQARLLVRLARGWRRIICWSKEPPDHRLVPELLYRLNVIRIDLWANN